MSTCHASRIARTCKSFATRSFLKRKQLRNVCLIIPMRHYVSLQHGSMQHSHATRPQYPDQLLLEPFVVIQTIQTFAGRSPLTTITGAFAVGTSCLPRHASLATGFRTTFVSLRDARLIQQEEILDGFHAVEHTRMLETHSQVAR